MTVTNTGQETLRFWNVLVRNVEPEIRVFVAEEGGTFFEYMMGVFGRAEVERRIESLAPGDSLNYELRVLYAHRSARRLALPHTGQYRAKVGYPVITLEPFRRIVLTSNVVNVRVRQPEGVDAEVWKTLSKPQFLYFLQSGLQPPEHPEVLEDAMKLLRALRSSSYHPALRWALNEFYNRAVYPIGRQKAQKDPDLEKIREALGIPVELEGPFPEDKRLDVKVTVDFGERMPFEQAFKEVSRVSRVPLSVAPELGIRRVSGYMKEQTLRRFMDGKDEYKAQWVHEGDGYRLIPAPAAQPAQQTQGR